MTSELKKFTCAACKREFESTQEDVDAACGHLCFAMDAGMTQRQGLEEISARD